MMKTLIRSILGLFLLPFLLVGAAAAQTNATQLDSLTVELWPDYDRPSLLVLLTGTLPEATALPATVRLPLPPGAELHAIARFNEAGALISDVESSDTGDELTLTTPGRRFRVEYYVPYEIDGDAHSFTFEWLSDLTIDAVSATVQQPLAAIDMRITPEPTGSAADRGDGLNYFQIAPRPLASGEPFTVEGTYTVETPTLSAPPATLPAGGDTAASETPATGGLNPLWLLAIPIALGLVIGAWYLGRQQGSGRARKPKPSRTTAATRPTTDSKQAAAGFCHNCGQPAQAGDVFCRKCGTALKK